MKRMLINATQAEERRLAIVDGQKLLDYEIEIEGREQRKGNIYKAVVTRVEPSLEACFVDYGEDRHGFLPFKEISRQYFQQGVSVSQARIQDAIREGQELLVQVEKEERGNKGAALTTFVSLAGRYVVLMPNNPRGGGVSRRIEGDDRAELKEALDQLEYPNGMSIIARTAGIGRSAPELQWDLNYLLKLWGAIDGAAKGGKGAYLIYQESSLVIRAIRDYFNNDIGDILIDTDDVYEQAQQFMAHVMPEHAARVKRYRDDAPLFSRFQIEHQIESAYARTVQLPSGGAIVIDHTEALVSVDVNSARAIKGSDIEETATRTNLEAADEVARQMRLRDLGGLIVIDFIDMEESRNRRDVENRLRDALRQDRARVQFGTISKFGLMEMSRQRLRPALSEGASIPCPRCGGSGHIRDTESSALQILRIIQEESLKDNTASVLCQVPVDVASYLLNEKRTEIAKIELKQRINVLMVPNKTLETPNYRLERLKHDDPRLDHIEASYKMAEEIEDPTSVTRRSQEPTNKQTPIIKGVLPDAPAPVAVPKPEATKAAALVPRAQVPATSSAAAGKGFFGWLKALFVGSDTPATKPVATTPAPKADEKREDRNARNGNRQGGRNGEARSDARPEGRNDTRGARPAGRNDNRDTRGGRGGRGGRNEGAAGAQRERFDGEGRAAEGVTPTLDANQAQQEQARSEGRPERGPRNERGDRNNRQQGRGGDRQESAERNQDGRNEARTEAPADERANRNAEGDANARSDAPEAREGRNSRGRGNRGGRGPRQDDANRVANGESQAQLGFGEANGSEATASTAEATQSPAPAGNVRNEGQEPREKRSRDRYGRDRGPRGDRAPRNESAQAEVNGESAAQATDVSHAGQGNAPAPTPVEVAAPVASHAVTAPAVNTVEPAQMGAAAPQAVARQASPTAAAPNSVGMPRVASYTLPSETMEQIAQAAGLQWVNSNAERVAAVRAAIEAEPKPVHVPRERPAPVEPDNSPLILVETKRDLRNMTLPFEATQEA
ncbi:Rne/Rng family ribonuclease [Rhodoferax aquaticus]|uniref:Ribonuclease E n=1 Tax=Rhodoferax aquaticus TaxID=2527691 RepID=A0A515ES24_9BURK|nr:Rne/Rng family ribonuclease [Rhodoferax aquaticus]QDL55438.1 Rne/Rng family ribonuclease [Rhodoferax aquaticus]